MLVSFNPYMANTRNKNQSTSFKSLKDGRIVAEEVAKHTGAAEECCIHIFNGAYKPTSENLKALLKAKEIAAKSPYEKISLPMSLDEAIEMLKRKATEAGINLGN